MILEMKVPSPGESITEVEIAEWLVFQFDGCLTDEQGVKIEIDSKALIFNQVLNKTHLLKNFGLVPGGNLSLRVYN